MRNIAIFIGTMLLLGLATQAHAGNYVLVQNNGWRLPSTSVPATAAQAEPNGDMGYDWISNLDKSTFSYDWQRSNANDQPPPAKVTLGVSLTTGECFCSGPDTFTSAMSGAGANFDHSTNSDGDTFSRYNRVAAQPAKPKAGATATGSISKSYGGAQWKITDTVNASASSSVEANFDPDAFGRAGGASARVTSISIALQ